jgi:hypothetical protein
VLKCKFLAECKLESEDYGASDRLFVKGKRPEVLKAVSKKAKEIAEEQPVIIMLANDKECNKMEGYLESGFHTFVYDETNYQAVLE